MTRRRWIADAVEGDRAFLLGSHAEHLARVLRAKVGQEFDVATGIDLRRARVVSVSADRVEFELGDRIDAAEMNPVILLLAVFKFDRMEWAVEKCTELGVSRIIPVIARRTDTHLASAAEKRVDRWRRVAVQASEQSRRIAPPEIASPVKLKTALAADGLKVLLAENEDERTLPEVLQASKGSVTLAVGPEGGWTDDELKMFGDAGWVSASLGQTILRAETAAIVATALATMLRKG